MGARTTGGVFPEISRSIGFRRALEILQLGKLCGLLGRIVRNWRRRSELTWRGQDPRLPRRHLRQDRIGPIPFARSCRHAAGPFDIGTVGFTALDDACGDLPSELEPDADVTWILNTRKQH